MYVDVLLSFLRRRVLLFCQPIMVEDTVGMMGAAFSLERSKMLMLGQPVSSEEVLAAWSMTFEPSALKMPRMKFKMLASSRAAVGFCL